MKKQETKSKSILEDPLKVIQERSKKQQNQNEKSSANEIIKQSKAVAQKDEQPDQIVEQIPSNIQANLQHSNLQLNSPKEKKEVKGNTNLSSKTSTQNSNRQQNSKEASNRSKMTNQNEKRSNSSKSLNNQQELSLGKVDNKIIKNESKRYLIESKLNPNQNDKNDNNQSFDLLIDNGQNDNLIESHHDFENHIGVQKTEQFQNKKGFRIISPIPPLMNYNRGDDKTSSDNQLEEIAMKQNHENILNYNDQDKSSQIMVQVIKNPSSKRYITPVKSNQNRFKSDQKQKDHDKLKNYANKVKSNSSLNDNAMPSVPTSNESYYNNQQKNHKPYANFRMDGNYYQKQSPEGKQQHSNESNSEGKQPSRNKFIIRQDRGSGQSNQPSSKNKIKRVSEDKKILGEEDRSNDRSTSGQKIFTKSFYEDEDHKKFMREKMKERQQMQIKREKQFLDQQESQKKREIQQAEEFNQKRMQVLQERQLLIQERMKKNRQYIENLEANKSSSRERLQLEARTKPLFIELQEKFEQNQMKEIEERKKILEKAKAIKQHYNFEEIIRHGKEYSHNLLERSSSKNNKSQQQEWHYEKPKFQSKLWEICEKEKEDTLKKEQEIIKERRQKEDRRHKFSEQLREDIQGSGSANKRQQQPLIVNKNRVYSARKENDTLESQFLNQSKIEFEQSPKQINGRNLIEITDEHNGYKRQRRQDDSKYSSIQSKNVHLVSINSVNNNSSATIDCNQLSYNYEKQDNIVINKISSSQHNLNHLNNRFRGSKLIQRQYTADQFLLSSEIDQQELQKQLRNKNNFNKYYMKQNFNSSSKKKSNYAHQLSQDSFIQNVDDDLSSFFIEQNKTPSRNNNYPHHKVKSAKERILSVNSSHHNHSLMKNINSGDHMRTEKSNESKNISEKYIEIIKLHDASLTQKLNNKSRSIYEKVEDIRVETKKMEQIANRQTQLLRVSSNEEVDRTFISDIYLKSIKAKLAVLDEITPTVNHTQNNHGVNSTQITIDQSIHSNTDNNQKNKKNILLNEEDLTIVNNNTIPTNRTIIKKQLKFADQ